MYDISFIFSDGGSMENPMGNLIINKILLAKWMKIDPRIIDEMDPVLYNYGMWCMEGENVARYRQETKQRMEAEMSR